MRPVAGLGGSIALVVALGCVGVPPSTADEPGPFVWPPPPPTSRDVCGTKYDTFEAAWIDDVMWRDELGHYVDNPGSNSTRGRSSVTLTASETHWDGQDWVTQTSTYPPMLFSTQADASCVGAADTVGASGFSCNQATSGTSILFTYTNTDDGTDWPRTYPRLQLSRWDEGQDAQMSFTGSPAPQVADGAQVSVRGGDTPMGGTANAFFIAPGTYDLVLKTDEAGTQKLPWRLYVPACGDYRPPKGDPHGQAAPRKPWGNINLTRHRSRAKVSMSKNSWDDSSSFKVVVHRRDGKVKTTSYTVSADKQVKRFRVRRGDQVTLYGMAGLQWARLATSRV